MAMERENKAPRAGAPASGGFAEIEEDGELPF